ncbi:MAG: hypothetical protein GXO64_04235 [Candidatus Micrarchaeota archaeon]|nr:hypothetical protein [Candidatus Micrarchaeota archaeon]
MKKGITPIISVVILLLIAAALGATAYTYFSGYMSGMIGTTFSVPSGGIYCSGGKITVIVRNDASDGTLTTSDLSIVTIDGNAVTPADITIEPGKAGTLINAASGYDSGYHEVVIGTSSNVVRQKVFCP